MKNISKLTDKENAIIYKDILNYLIKELYNFKHIHRTVIIEENTGNEKLTEEDREFLRGIEAARSFLKDLLIEVKTRTFDKNGKYVCNKQREDIR